MNSDIPREVLVQLSEQARRYAYAQLGLNPDTSNPSEYHMQRIVAMGEAKYNQLLQEWRAKNPR